MSRPAAFILMVGLLAVIGGAVDDFTPPPGPGTLPATTSPAVAPPATSTFASVDVFIDPRGKALACYQVEIVATAGNVKLVGIEGGDDASFSDAPYYDKRALLSGQRVIIGAYTLASDLPTGKTRVARLMLHISGPIAPQYRATLHVAGASDESPIPAVVSLVAHSSPRPVGMEKTVEKTAFTGAMK